MEGNDTVVSKPRCSCVSGGDFADGLIAYEGRWLGGETFVSFDEKAVSLIVRQGQQTKLLA